MGPEELFQRLLDEAAAVAEEEGEEDDGPEDEEEEEAPAGDDKPQWPELNGRAADERKALGKFLMQDAAAARQPKRRDARPQQPDRRRREAHDPADSAPRLAGEKKADESAIFLREPSPASFCGVAPFRFCLVASVGSPPFGSV